MSSKYLKIANYAVLWPEALWMFVAIFLGVMLIVKSIVGNDIEGDIRYSSTGCLEVRTKGVDNTITNCSCCANEVATIRCVHQFFSCELTKWVQTIKPGQTVVVDLHRLDTFYIYKGAGLSEFVSFVKCSEIPAASAATSPSLE